MNISACIITDGKDLKALQECIDSVYNNCIEILIGANNNSFLKVKELFKSNQKVRVIEQVWKKDFSKARNEVIILAAGAWILIIDTDERLNTKINSLDPKYDFYFASQMNNKRKYWNARVFKNGKGYFYKNKMHESLEHHITLKNSTKSNIELLHSGYELSTEDMMKKLDRNYELMLTDKGNPVRNYHLGNYEMLMNKDYKKAMKYYYKAMKDKVNNEHKASILNCLFTCQTLLNYDTRVRMKTVSESIKVLPEQIHARINIIEYLLTTITDGNKAVVIPVIKKQLCRVETIDRDNTTRLYSDIQLNTNYFKNKKEELKKWQYQ